MNAIPSDRRLPDSHFSCGALDSGHAPRPSSASSSPCRRRSSPSRRPGPAGFHEIKQDGYRNQLVVQRGKACAYSRRGLDWTADYQPIVEVAARLPCGSAIIDGEMVVQDEKGVSDFGALRSAIAKRPDRLAFIAFDLLHLNGEDLRQLPIEERRAKLWQLLEHADRTRLGFSEEYMGEGAEVFRVAAGMGLEGIVSKRRGSAYKSGSSKAWLKTKAFETGSFEVIGVDTTPLGAPVALLASSGEDGARYAGNAFLSLPGGLRSAFWKFVEGNAVESSPIAGLNRKGAIWLRPGLRAGVRYLRGEGLLRHGSVTDLTIDTTG